MQRNAVCSWQPESWLFCEQGNQLPLLVALLLSQQPPMVPPTLSTQISSRMPSCHLLLHTADAPPAAAHLPAIPPSCCCHRPKLAALGPRYFHACKEAAAAGMPPATSGQSSIQVRGSLGGHLMHATPKPLRVAGWWGWMECRAGTCYHLVCIGSMHAMSDEEPAQPMQQS
jgi:hypothetical protein